MKLRHISLLALCFSAFNFSTKAQESVSRPKLVVGIVVDQMRWDYLYRYSDRYTEGGFKRLLKEGFSCENTNIDYIPTVTAIGHSSIYTGSVPSIHGIAGNDFIVQKTGKEIYCVSDSTVKSIGTTSNAGEMSPRNLRVSTITDELRLATNFRSKTIGIALKDRGGILPAGHTANAAYWFDDKTGNWITSTYYMQDLPEWMKKFNNKKLPEQYLNKDWNTLFPIKTYVQSTPDDNKYEGAFKGMNAPVFPIPTSKIKGADFGLIRSTPYGNSLTFDVAKEAVKNEALGKGALTDFLAVSFSSTDYVGHRFGINSIEVEDTYLRFDRDLANFLSYLDTQVGKGNYVVFLSADHGAAHNPTFLKDHNIPAGNLKTKEITLELNKALEAEFKTSNLVLAIDNYQVNLNNPLIAKENLNEEAIRATCVKVLRNREEVAFAVDIEKVAQSAIPEILKNRIINGYNHDHSGVVQIIPKPGYFAGSVTGTTHGVWNPYDTHIPFVLMGWGVKQGSTARVVNMTDISATLAALLHIQAPSGCIGKPVTEALK